MYHVLVDTNTIAWAAGFLDGEGTITIKRYLKPYAGSKSVRYQAYASCGQADKPNNAKAIKELQTLFGGSIARYTQKPKDKDWLNTISWAVVSNDAYKCAQLILPYLRIKKEQAQLLVQFVDSLVHLQGRRLLTVEELTKRDKFWHKMRKLNVKGTLRLQRLSEMASRVEDAIV